MCSRKCIENMLSEIAGLLDYIIKKLNNNLQNLATHNKFIGMDIRRLIII